MANKAFTGLTAITGIIGTDIIAVTSDPGGTPLSRKITVANYAKTLVTPWLALPALTYVSATSATLVGDYTAFLTIGAKFKCTNVTVKYGYILSSTYSAGTGLTTLNLVTNTSYALASAAITSPYISYSTPPDFPTWLSWTPAISGMTVVGTPTYTGYFSATGRIVYGGMELQSTTTLAANGSSTYCPVPITGSTGSMFVVNWSNDYGADLYHSMLASNGNIFFPTWAASDRKFVASFFYRL